MTTEKKKDHEYILGPTILAAWMGFLVICGWAFAHPNAFERPTITVQPTEDIDSEIEETQATETSQPESSTTTAETPVTETTTATTTSKLETPETETTTATTTSKLETPATETTTTTTSKPESSTTTAETPATETPTATASKPESSTTTAETPATETTTTATTTPTNSTSSSPSPIISSGEQPTTTTTETAKLTTASPPETEPSTAEKPTTTDTTDSAVTSDSQAKDLSQPETLGQVKFEINTVELSPEAEQNLEDIISKIKEYDPGKVAIKVEGHTSSVGGAELNQEISQDRADAVVEFLKQQNLPYQVVGKGMGSSQPLSGTDAADAVNQRTVIILTPTN